MHRPLALLVLLGGALAAGVRIAPTSPPVRTALPGEIVTHVFRVEGGGGPYTPVFTSSAGFPILSRPRPVTPPAYLPVTERVPRDAREGTVDVLTVRLGDAVAEVRTRVGYRPRLRLEAPGTVSFRLPFVAVRGEVVNAGNGPDEAELQVRFGKQPLLLRRARLGPGERLVFSFDATRPGVYEVRARFARAKAEARRLVLVEPPSEGFLRPLYLTGSLTLGYAWPSGGRSLAFSIGGPLSDYLLFSSSAAWGGFGLPQARVGLIAEQWSMEVQAGPYTAGRFSLWEGPVRADFDLALAPGFRAEAGLSWQLPDQRHRLSVSAADRYTLSLSGSGGKGVRWGYGVRFTPAAGQLDANASLSGTVRRVGWALGLQGSWVPGRWGAGASLGLSASWGSLGARLSGSGDGVQDWGVAWSSTGRQLFGEGAWPSSFGLEAGMGGLSGQVWLRPTPNLEFSLEAALPRSDPWYADGSAVLDLPPLGRAEAGLRLTPDGLRSRVGFEALTRLASLDEPGAPPLRYAWGAQLVWPLEASELHARARLGDDVRYLEASLGVSPFEPAARLGLEGGVPVGAWLLVASGRFTWPDGSLSASLGARYTFQQPVPPDWVAFFGGRKAARVEGRFVPDAPVPPALLKGIRVYVGDQSAETDERGRFSLLAPPGRQELRVDPATLPAVFVPAFTKKALVLKARKTVRVDFPLEVRGDLEGQVAVRGEAPPGLRVPVAVEDAAGRRFWVVAENGRFRVPGLRPGHYRVRLSADLLPPGFRVIAGEVEVDLRPGEVARVRLVVAAPPRAAFKPVPVAVLSVEPETDRAPPGSAPLVVVKVKGGPARVLVYRKGRLLGLLAREKPGLWKGRVVLPRGLRGPQVLEAVAERPGTEPVRYPFLIDVDPRAPWGLIQSPFLVRPGWQGVPVRVHLYAPARAVGLEVGGRRYVLAGRGADWQGVFDVPKTARGRLALRVRARLLGGEEAKLERVILVR